MKSCTLVVLCSAVIFASLTSVHAENPFQAGFRATTACFADELVIRKEVQVHNRGGLGSVLNTNFEKIETFAPGNGAKISMVKATNEKKNGATVQIVNGGIGQPSITLKFQNKGHGFHFKVEVYATKQ